MEKIFKIALCLLFFGFSPIYASAATLSLSPSSGSYSVGQTFSININVASLDQAMNAASGTVSYPWDKLSIVSISKVGSIFSLWVEEPSFSNASGTASFEAIVPNPGWSGANGKIMTITFRAKASGVANLSFSSGSVLANDGTGANILDNFNVAVVNIGSPDLPPAEVLAPIVPEKDAPLISSSTHPDQEKWYAVNTAEFSWTLPENVLEVRTALDKSPKSLPSVRHPLSLQTKKFENLSDGIHYFHLQMRTKEGWRGVGHYRVKVDTTPPEPFTIKFPHGAKGFEPQPVILFNTTDKVSGISQYDVKIGSEGLERVAPPAKSNPYPLPPQYPGTHTVIVSAIDQAGNSTSTSADFTIEGIEPPTITDYPEEIEHGDIVKIRGTTYPNSDVNITIFEEDKEIHQELARSNSLGDFGSVITKQLSPGVYTFTARVTDGRGATSSGSSPLTIVVNSAFLSYLVHFALNYLSLAILVILGLGGIFGVGLWTWYRLSRSIRSLRHEAIEAEQMLQKSFDILKNDISTHITRLKIAKSKRDLTSEEVLFLEQFKDELEEAKDVLAKEVKNISHS